MKAVVVGAGYVGLVTAACLAESGSTVAGVDTDTAKVALLNAGGVPIYEPGLDAMLARNLASQRLAFGTSLRQALEGADVVFIAVGTPPQEDGSADLQHVLAVARQIGQHLQGPAVVVNKSTVPVGTARLVEQEISRQLHARDAAHLPFVVVSNPEFLKEGAAIDDFMHPDRIVIGVPDGEQGERARSVLTRLYAPFNRHHDRTVWMDVTSAELTKYAANAMLATRISFMNEIALLADELGADIDHVRRGIGSDQRIGHSFLYAGTGYGGSCFPKDTRALIHTAGTCGRQMQVVQAVEQVNAEQKLALVRAVEQVYGADLSGRRFALWGLAFKPNTNDMREAPSRRIIAELLRRGATVVAYDPVAQAEAHDALCQDLGLPSLDGTDTIRFAPDALTALHNADALLIVTEWKSFHNPDFSALAQRLRLPVVLDGRNLYDPTQLQELGMAYIGIGRRNALGRELLRHGIGAWGDQPPATNRFIGVEQAVAL